MADYSIKLKAQLDTSDVEQKLKQLNAARQQQAALPGSSSSGSTAANAAVSKALQASINNLNGNIQKLTTAVSRLQTNNFNSTSQQLLPVSSGSVYPNNSFILGSGRKLNPAVVSKKFADIAQQFTDDYRNNKEAQAAYQLQHGGLKSKRLLQQRAKIQAAEASFKQKFTEIYGAKSFDDVRKEYYRMSLSGDWTAFRDRIRENNSTARKVQLKAARPMIGMLAGQTMNAVGELLDANGNKTGSTIANLLGGTASGAAMGGFAGGPIGAAVGAGIGLATSGLQELVKTTNELNTNFAALSKAVEGNKNVLANNVESRQQAIWQRGLSNRSLDELNAEKAIAQSNLTKAQENQARYATVRSDYSNMINAVRDSNIVKDGATAEQIAKEISAKFDDFINNENLDTETKNQFLAAKNADMLGEISAGLKADKEVQKWQNRVNSLDSAISGRKSVLDAVKNSSEAESIASDLQTMNFDQMTAKVKELKDAAAKAREEFEAIKAANDTSEKGVEKMAKALDDVKKSEGVLKAYENGLKTFEQFADKNKTAPAIEAYFMGDANEKIEDLKKQTAYFDSFLKSEEFQSMGLSDRKSLFESINKQKAAIDSQIAGLNDQKAVFKANALADLEARESNLSKLQADLNSKFYRPNANEYAINDLAKQGYMINRNSDAARIESYQTDMKNYTSQLVKIQKESLEVQKAKEDIAKYE